MSTCSVLANGWLLEEVLESRIRGRERASCSWTISKAGLKKSSLVCTEILRSFKRSQSIHRTIAGKVSSKVLIPATTFPPWLTEWMKAKKLVLWGAADLREFSTPLDEAGHGFPFALSWAIPMNPRIMASIQNRPNQAYAYEYVKVNLQINELSDSNGLRSQTGCPLQHDEAARNRRCHSDPQGSSACP